MYFPIRAGIGLANFIKEVGPSQSRILTRHQALGQVNHTPDPGQDQ